LTPKRINNVTIERRGSFGVLSSTLFSPILSPIISPNWRERIWWASSQKIDGLGRKHMNPIKIPPPTKKKN